MLAKSSFSLAFFIFSSPSSRLIDWIGYKQTLVVSLFVQVVGSLMFIFAAKLVNFPLFLSAVFVVEAGVTGLRVSANPYVAILGTEDRFSVRLTLAQAFNSIGALLAPLLGGAFILTSSPKLESKAAIAATVRGPYLIIAAGLLVLCVAVAPTRLSHIEHPQEVQTSQEDEAAPGRNVLRYRHTVLGAVGNFLYVGVEVGLASIAVNYFKLEGISSLKTASYLVLLYWFGAMVGRLLGSWVLTRMQAGKLLGVFGVCSPSLLAVSALTSGQVAIGALVLCGFFNSIQFPNILALGIAGLGSMTNRGSGLIMTAIIGGAIIPYLLGALADQVGIQRSFVLPIACYLYIAWYGLWGRNRKKQPKALSLGLKVALRP